MRLTISGAVLVLVCFAACGASPASRSNTGAEPQESAGSSPAAGVPGAAPSPTPSSTVLKSAPTPTPTPVRRPATTPAGGAASNPTAEPTPYETPTRYADEPTPPVGGGGAGIPTPYTY